MKSCSQADWIVIATFAAGVSIAVCGRLMMKREFELGLSTLWFGFGVVVFAFFTRGFLGVIRWINQRKRPPDDAIELVEFVMELEDKFRIAIPEEDYEKIKTVDDAKRYFEERKNRP